MNYYLTQFLQNTADIVQEVLTMGQYTRRPESTILFPKIPREEEDSMQYTQYGDNP